MTKRSLTTLILFFFSSILFPIASFAQLSGPGPDIDKIVETGILEDKNGSGFLEVIAFGDSITRGVGDFISAGQHIEGTTHPTVEAGYPLRLEALLKVSISNKGIPGERLSTQGLSRFASQIPGLRPDIVIISGGSNDAIDLISTRKYFRAVQTMVNIALASGVQPMLVTAPPTCCDRAFFNTQIQNYDHELRLIAKVNDIPIADVNRAYQNTCQVKQCHLLNLPEGLHPNILGYDVMGEVIAAKLLGVDIFVPDGAKTLEDALNLQEGSVITQPDPVTQQ